MSTAFRVKTRSSADSKLRRSSAVSTTVVSALMAVNYRQSKSVEGIIDDDVGCSIRDLTYIGHDAMIHTDAVILRIMTSK